MLATASITGFAGISHFTLRRRAHNVRPYKLFSVKPEIPVVLRQHRTIPALRLKHRSGSCGTASALPKCRVAVPASCFGGKSPSHSATAAPASVRCFRHWQRSPLQHPVLSALLLSICRTSLAVSALRIMRCCLYNFTSISPAPESDCPSSLFPNRAYRSSSSAPPPQNKRHVPPYLYHKVGTCRYIIMILSRQSHQAMQPSAKLLRLAFSFCWLRLAMISLLRPIRLVLKWKNGRSGTVKISTGRM